jgi:hypothetical protein
VKAVHGFTDDITAPAQEPFCRCYYRWLFNLRDLPDEMLTQAGRRALTMVGLRSGATASGEFSAFPRTDDAAEGVFARAGAVDRLGWLPGLRRVVTVHDPDQWHAAYDDGPDDITLEDKFFDLSPQGRLHVLVHEIGHRGQVVAPAVYAEFKRRHLDRMASFRDMANEAHLEDLARRGTVEGGLAAEVFAEGYARAAIGLPMPAELAAFWSELFEQTGLSTQREASYTPIWPNKITRCQRCSMFLRINANPGDNACTAVEGRISAHGHCKKFALIGARQEVAA